MTWTTKNDNGQPDNATLFAWAVNHSYVLGNKDERITGQMNQMTYRGRGGCITSNHYTRDFPKFDVLGPQLIFPSVNRARTTPAQSKRRVH